MKANEGNGRKPRGFAALSLEQRKEISRKGGVSAHVKGSAHEWDSVTAREAGRKGGLSHWARRTPTNEAPPAANSDAPAEDERNAS